MMFLLPRPRRELASALAPTQRRAPPREKAPPRGVGVRAAGREIEIKEQQGVEVMKHQILRLPETARKWSRVVAPVLARHISAARGRFRRAVEQQELVGKFVD